MWNPFARRLELAVKIDDEWAFQANGAPHLVIGAFGDWLGIVQASHDETPAPVTRHPVGFGKYDLEAETSLAD